MRERTFGARMLALVLAVLMATPGAFAVAGLPQLPDPGTVPVSKQQQEQLGLKAMSEVYQQMPVLPDSNPVTQYVQQLGKRLVQVIPQQNSWPYQFHVIPQKDVNAFALPGGPIFINVGTVLAADNESQLAGVMSHEMSHVYMQHQIKEMQKAGMTQGVAGIVGGLLGAVLGGTAGTLANMGAQYAGGILSLKYSRQEEAQADAVGAIIMYKAGYNPRSLAEFFQKLEKQGGAGGPQFLSDHPNPGNRVEAIASLIKTLPRRQFTNGDTGSFQQVHQVAMGRKPLTSQQVAQQAKQGGQGSPGGDSGSMGQPTSGDVMPSGGMQTLNHSAFQMQYPQNWQVFGDQNSAVTIAPQAGLTQNAVAYGVIVNAFQPESNTIDGAMHELEQSLRQSNPDLRLVGHDEAITINGQQGRSVDLLGSSPVMDKNNKAEKERDWLVALPSSNNTVIYLVFIAPDRDFDRLRPTFEQMLRSFQMRG